MGDTRSAAEIVAAMVDRIEAESEHVYWWGFGDENLALVRQRDDAAAAIEGTFRHASVKVRRYMARLLRGLDRSRAKASLVALLFDPEDAVRLEACGAVLGEIPIHPHVPEGEEVPVVDPTVRGDLVRSLAELLSSSKPYVQSDAQRMLGRLGGSDVVDVLWRAIAGADARDRWSLFQTLAQIPEGRPRLLDALRDPNPDIRAPAYACLVSAEQGALAGDRVALTVAVVRGLSDSDRDVQQTAVRLAGRLRISIAEPKLLALAQQADVAGALRALGELRSESALPIALAAAQTGGHRQGEAIEALVLHGRRADSERALLCAFAAADDIDLRADIVKALAEVGSAESLPVLETFLRREARRLTKRTRKDVKHTLLPAIQRLRKPPAT